MSKVKYTLARDSWRTKPTLPMPRPNRRRDYHDLQEVRAGESFDYQALRNEVIRRGHTVQHQKVR